MVSHVDRENACLGGEEGARCRHRPRRRCGTRRRRHPSPPRPHGVQALPAGTAFAGHAMAMVLGVASFSGLLGVSALAGPVSATGIRAPRLVTNATIRVACLPYER